MTCQQKIAKSLIGLIFFLAFPAIGQIETYTDKTANELVADILTASNLQVMNVQYSGSFQAMGRFDGTNCNIGMDEGILLTTGTVGHNFSRGLENGPFGPNNNDQAGIDNFAPGDAQLSDIINQKTFNATVLEFDFIPESNHISFNYVFASEEYIKYVNKKYNDVFAFFLSGPGITGSKNIALLPYSDNTTVSIDSVNHIRNSEYFVWNGDGNGGDAASDPTVVQYNGFTKLLTAESDVICGATYHIRLVIADANDPILDSGVFLKARSFKSVAPVAIRAVYQSNFYEGSFDFTEGCENLELELIRFDSIQTMQKFTIHYSGSADKDDYGDLPSEVELFPGENSIRFPAGIVNDLKKEGIETFQIRLQSASICGNNFHDTLTIRLSDPKEMTIENLDDVVVDCPDSNTGFKPTVKEGIKPFTYTWTDGSTQLNNWVSPSASKIYSLTVKDNCRNSVTQRVQVDVLNSKAEIEIPRRLNVCAGDVIDLEPIVSGGKGKYSFLWLPDSSIQSSKVVQIDSSQVIQLQVQDECETYTTEASIQFKVRKPHASFIVVPHDGAEDILKSMPVGFHDASDRAVAYEWNLDDDLLHYEEDVTGVFDAGKYTIQLVVFDEFGCSDTSMKDIIVYDVPTFYLPNSFTPNDDGKNDVFFPKGIGIKYSDMTIFNRQGEELFQTHNIFGGWDGTHNGIPVKVDTYVYLVRIIAVDGTEKVFRGNVNLIR